MSLVECDKFKLHKSCLVVTGTIMISGFCVLLTLSRYLGGQHNIEQLLNLLHLVWSSVLCLYSAWEICHQILRVS